MQLSAPYEGMWSCVALEDCVREDLGYEKEEIKFRSNRVGGRSRVKECTGGRALSSEF